MSWKEKINTPCRIQTGDGKVYFPLWRPTGKEQGYNLSEFEFPNVPGTKVDREQPKGQRFNLLVYFQGDDHLDKAEEFRISANDKRPWNISHPFFGDIIAQPASLSFNQESYNVTVISGVLIETITDDFPQETVSVTEKVMADSENVDNLVVQSFVNNAEPTPADIQTLQNNNNQAYNNASKLVPSDLAEEYFNLFKRASSDFNNAIQEPDAAIRSANAVISAPGMFRISVFSRLDILRSNLDALIRELPINNTVNGKRVFEANGSAMVKAMAMASVNPIDNDYTNAVDILRSIDFLVNGYNLFIDTLNLIQSLNGGDEDSYLPDAETITSLSSLLKFTISKLHTLAFGASQQRRFYLEDDSNLILLTHRLYGLDLDDVNLNKFMNQNGIGLNEILQIRKGREIVYYI